MPEIHFSNIPNNELPKNLASRWYVWAELLSYMYWPDDEKERSGFVSYTTKLWHAGIDIEIKKLSRATSIQDKRRRKSLVAKRKQLRTYAYYKHGSLLDALLNFSQTQIIALAKKSYRAQWTCGIVGINYVRMFMSNYSEKGGPSLNKVVAITNEYFTGRTVYTGISKIKSCWSEYKSVAHLWATFVVFASRHHVGKMLDDDLLSEFLSLARELEHWFLDHSAHGQKYSIIDPDLMWRIPASLELPNPIEFPDPPLTSIELDFLSDYVAPKSDNNSDDDQKQNSG